MLFINGKVLNLVHTEIKDKFTGELKPVHTIEILHQSRGKSVVDYLKIDSLVCPQWEKIIGKEITAEVRVYAMKTEDGSVMHGFTLADKKGLPTVQTRQSQAQPQT